MILKGKVAIITGSSRGIGRAIAELFVEHGASIAINYVHSEDHARQMAQSISARTGIAPMVIKADVSLQEDAIRLIDSVASHFGCIDILVNNAGITVRSSLAEIGEEEWDRVLDVNLKGVFLCCKAVAPLMLDRQSGAIVNIASIRGITGSNRSLHYAVSKAGVLAMTKCLALELAPHVRVNAVAPGYTLTDLHAQLDREAIHRIESTIPLRRFGTTNDVAAAALFLASDLSSYVTGETVVVSGGLAMR